MKKKPKTSQLESTVYHEAGHAVMCLVENLPFRHVTIVPNEERGTLGHLLLNRRGVFDPEKMEYQRMRRKLEAHILCSLAGPAAEGIFVGRHNWRGARGDLHSMADFAGYCVGSAEEASAFVNWLWVRAQNTIKVRWIQVEAVAKALLEQKTLSRRAAQMLFHGALGNLVANRDRKS